MKEQAKLMEQEIAGQLRYFPRGAWAELKQYKEELIDSETRKIILGVLSLLGYKVTNLKAGEWGQVQGIMAHEKNLLEEMMNLDICASVESADTDLAQRWKESLFATRGTDLHAGTSKLKVAAKPLLSWLSAVRVTRNIATAIHKAAEPLPADELADGLFDAIDTNGNDAIELEEFLVYVVAEHSKRHAHRLFMALDADGNGLISREEWKQCLADDGLRSELQTLIDKEVTKINGTSMVQRSTALLTSEAEKCTGVGEKPGCKKKLKKTKKLAKSTEALASLSTGASTKDVD